MNAVRHGLRAKQLILPGESELEFRRFERATREELAPETEVEHSLVDRVIACLWRLRRVGEIERGVCAAERVNFDGEDEGVGGAVWRDSQRGDALTKLCRYESHLQRSALAALHELERRQARRRGEYTPLPVAVGHEHRDDGTERWAVGR